MPPAEIAAHLQEHVRARVGGHAYPRQVEFVDDFPMTASGKIKRKELREREILKSNRAKVAFAALARGARGWYSCPNLVKACQ